MISPAGDTTAHVCFNFQIPHQNMNNTCFLSSLFNVLVLRLKILRRSIYSTGPFENFLHNTVLIDQKLISSFSWMYFKNVSKMHNHVSFLCVTFSCYVFSNIMNRLFPNACLFNLAIQTDAVIKCNGPLVVVFICFVLVLDFISRIISRNILIHLNSSLC